MPGAQITIVFFNRIASFFGGYWKLGWRSVEIKGGGSPFPTSINQYIFGAYNGVSFESEKEAYNFINTASNLWNKEMIGLVTDRGVEILPWYNNSAEHGYIPEKHPNYEKIQLINNKSYIVYSKDYKERIYAIVHTFGGFSDADLEAANYLRVPNFAMGLNFVIHDDNFYEKNRSQFSPT